MSTAAEGAARARGWVEHLRAGGTTPWAAWTGGGPAGGPADGLPGAQQLELLRRLNQAGRVPLGLAEEVLAASAAGRGRPDLELVGAGPARPFGARPVDPGALPDDELVRVATSVLADRLAAAALPDRSVGRPGARAPRWRRGYRLVGDPWLADPAREALRRRGRPPGGRRPTVLVVGTDLPTMLTDAWRHRVVTEGGPSWADWLDGVVALDRVPPRVDLLRAAGTWAARVGRGRVRVVLDPARLPRLTGARHPLPEGPAVSADAAELARRVAPVLGLLVGADRRTRLLRQVLLPRLAEAGGAPLALPVRHEAWVRRRAARLREDVRRAGYAVVGDPATLTAWPGEVPLGAAEPSDAGVLGVAVRLLLEPGTSPQTSPSTDTEDR